MEEIKYPQFIYMDSEIKKKYLDPLRQDPLSPFKELGDAYLMAAAYGMSFNLKQKSNSRTDIRVFNSWTPEYKLLFRVIAAADNDFNFDILLNGTATLRSVEEYANGGASLLYDKILRPTPNQSLKDDFRTGLSALKQA